MAQASIDLKQRIINIQQYTNSTDRVDFVFERYTKTGIDLAQLQAWILLDTVDIIVSNITENFIQTYSETKVKLEWLIDSGITQEKRDIPFQIVFTNGEDVKVYTTVGKLKINESIGVEDIIIPSNLSLFQQWLKKMETLAALVENGKGAGGSGGGSESGGSGSGDSTGSTENLYISKVETLYAKNTSKEIVPESGWYKYKPDWEEGYYIWQKICIHYKDGTSFESVPTCIIGSENEYILSKLDALQNITQEDINRLNKLLDDLEEDAITIGTLKAHLAKIDVAQIGDLFAETLQAFTATVVSSTINDAYIKNLVSENITVADLKAKDTLTERVVLLGDDSSPTIAFEDGTQQFYDSNGNVRVQIGQDDNGDFNFVVRGQDGTTALFDEKGITTNAIADGLIKENMIGDGEVSKEKINFPIIEPNEFGGVDITQVYDGDEKFGVEYTTFKENINSRFTETDEKITIIDESTNNISSVVDEVNKSISNKIWQTDISNSIKEYSDGQTEIINEIRDRIIDQEENLEGFQTTVSETYSTKTELADVTDNISDLQKWSTETWKTEAKQLIGKDYITSTVGEYYTKTSDFEDIIDGVQTTANQTSEKFNWLVKSGTNATDFTLTDRTATLIADNINLNGLVTFSGLNSEVKDKIDNGISKVDVMYANHTSSTTAPTTGWSTTAPAWENGKYMWQKTVTTYISGQVSETSPTVLTGATGSPGLDGKDGTSITILGSYSSESDLNVSHPTGNLGDGYIVNGDLYVWNGDFWENVGRIQGDKGDVGVGVSKIIEQYYLSSSNTNQSDGNWSESSPSWVSGKYIWTRSKLEYDNGNISYTTPVLANALNSANSTAKNADDNATYSLNTVKAWGYGNNTTYINGGKIYTGSITADKITSNDIIGTNGWINLAKGTFNYGNQLVWDGKKLQVSAEAVKISIKDVIDDIDSDISSVDSKATNAQNTADTASGKADVAQTAANNAQSTANKAQSDIDNLEVGGRNLFGFNKGVDVNSISKGTVVKLEDTYGLKITSTQDSDCIHCRISKIGFGTPGYYTFSADAYASATINDVAVNICDKGNTKFALTTTKQKIVVTANVTNYYQESNYNGFVDIEGSLPIGTIIYLENIKIERGTIPTDWSPAPEDVDANISALGDRVTSTEAALNVNSESITSVVKRTETLEKWSNDLEIGGRNLFVGTNVLYERTKDSTVDKGYVYKPDLSYDLNSLIGKTVTMSLYVHSTGSRALGTSSATQLNNRFGAHGTVIWGDSTGTLSNKTEYPFTSLLEQTVDNKRISSQITLTPPTGYDTITALNVIIQLYAKPGPDNDETWLIGYPKLEIGNKATDWSPAPEDMATDAELTTAKSEIKQTTDAITSNVTAMDGRLSTVEQTASGLTVRVSNTENELANLEIGGRNLLYNSNFKSGFYRWVNSGMTVEPYTSDSTYKHAIRFYTPVPGNSTYRMYQDTSLFTHVVGETYTLSFMAKADTNTQLQSNVAASHNVKNYDLTTSWQKFTHTYIATSTGSLTFWSVEANVNIYLTNIKLEKGNKATDWTPAPEDVDSSISSVDTKATNAQNAANNAQTSANNAQTSANNAQSTANSASGKADTAQSMATAAGKTATNYLNFSQNGLIIGDHTAGTLGKNVLVGSEYIDFRNNDTVLARYGADKIQLGLSNNTNASVSFCDDEFIFGYDTDYGMWSVKSKNELIIQAPTDLSLLSYARASYTTSSMCEINMTTHDGLTPLLRLCTTDQINNDITHSCINIGGDYIDMYGVAGSNTVQITLLPFQNRINILSGSIDSTGEYITVNPNGFRIAYGNYGSFIRNDGNSTYFLLTNSGDIYGSWNTLRPLIINNSTGNVTINDTALETNGNVTPNNHLVLKNTKGVHIKNASGTNIEMLSVTNSNVGVIGYGPYANNYPLQIHGGTIQFYTKTPNANWKPYFSPGDSFTIRWYGAGTVTGSGKSLLFTIPLSKPAIGCSGVTVTTNSGFICRQNNAYCYGSNASTWTKDVASYSAAIDSNGQVRINASMNNNTNVTNNSSIAVDASITITFV